MPWQESTPFLPTEPCPQSAGTSFPGYLLSTQLSGSPSPRSRHAFCPAPCRAVPANCWRCMLHVVARVRDRNIRRQKPGSLTVPPSRIRVDAFPALQAHPWFRQGLPAGYDGANVHYLQESRAAVDNSAAVRAVVQQALLEAGQARSSAASGSHEQYPIDVAGGRAAPQLRHLKSHPIGHPGGQRIRLGRKFGWPPMDCVTPFLVPHAACVPHAATS